MKLTKSTDIAFMILVWLAKSKKRTSARELSQSLKFPLNHINKVVQILSRGGYIRTLRGKGGGIELALSPKDIRLREIIQLVDGPICLMECTINKDVCVLSHGCKLRLKLKKAQEKMTSVFETTTVADILPSKQKI